MNFVWITWLFCSKVCENYNFHPLIHNKNLSAGHSVEGEREELLILYLNQMNDDIRMVGVNLVYFRTNVHCLYSVIVSFGENVFIVSFPKLL